MNDHRDERRGDTGASRAYGCAAQQARQRKPQQRQVRGQADHALFGCDSDRDRV